MNFFKSIGHFLASVGPAIFKFERDAAPVISKVASVIGKVQEFAPQVESLTALISPGAVDVEKGIFGGFGVAHDIASAVGEAVASASVVTLTVDTTGSKVHIDSAVLASILAAGKYIKSHPLAPATPVIAPAV